MIPDHNLQLKSPGLSDKDWYSKSAIFGPGLKDLYSIGWKQRNKPFFRFQLTLAPNTSLFRSLPGEI